MVFRNLHEKLEKHWIYLNYQITTIPVSVYLHLNKKVAQRILAKKPLKNLKSFYYWNRSNILASIWCIFFTVNLLIIWFAKQFKLEKTFKGEKATNFCIKGPVGTVHWFWPRTTDTQWLNPKFFSAQIQIPIQNKYLGWGYRGLVLL